MRHPALFGFLLLFSLLTPLLCATHLSEYKIYEKPDRIDLMLTFDTPWHGKITKTVKADQTLLKLEGVTFDKERATERTDNPLLQTITILPYPQGAVISLQRGQPFRVNASRTIDNLGLRIRIEPQEVAADTLSPMQPAEDALQKRVEEEPISFAFLKIMLVLLLLIATLWFLKRWLERGREGSWLFGAQKSSAKIAVEEQRAIDIRNRVMLIRYEERRYLVLIGEGMLLLDKFEDDDAAFEVLLQKQGKKLSDYLQK